MKPRALSCIGMMILAAGCALQAQNTGNNWYFRSDLGTSIALETDVRDFLGTADTGEVEFDPGLRLGVAGGYRVLPWLALELESGVLFNSVDHVEGESIDASLTQVPFMGNVVVQCNNFDRFVPFLGVGAGGVSSIMDIDERFDVGAGALFVEGNDADIVFGYHAFAGFRYEFNDRMGVGLIYRFMGIQDSSWDVDNEVDGGDDLEIALDEVFTHSISFLFHLHF